MDFGVNCPFKAKKAQCQHPVSLVIGSEPSALLGDQEHFRELWLLTLRVLTAPSCLSGLWELKVTCVCVCACVFLCVSV